MNRHKFSLIGGNPVAFAPLTSGDSALPNQSVAMLTGKPVKVAVHSHVKNSLVIDTFSRRQWPAFSNRSGAVFAPSTEPARPVAFQPACRDGNGVTKRRGGIRPDSASTPSAFRSVSSHTTPSGGFPSSTVITQPEQAAPRTEHSSQSTRMSVSHSRCPEPRHDRWWQPSPRIRPDRAVADLPPHGSSAPRQSGC